MTPDDPLAACAGAVSFERALLTAVADRIARAPSLPAKMYLCRRVWGAACSLRDLQRALPADVGSIALASRPAAEAEAFVAALQALPTEAAFLRLLRETVAPVVASLYAACATATALARAARPLDRAARRWRDVGKKPWPWLDRGTGSCAYRSRQAAPPHLDPAAIRLGARVAATALTTRTRASVSEPARERAIRGLRYGEARAETWFVSSVADHEAYLHQLIAFEINTFEAVSRHLAEYADMPWEFHWDMACQIRDELRHLEMWLERIRHIGGRLGSHALGTHEFTVCAGEGLSGRLVLLERLVESGALDGLDLNRCLWESRGDPTMVAYLEQVQRDEIAHVRQGNKWLRRLCGDDADLLAAIDAAERAARARLLEAARVLERRGVVAPGNVELVRRKFDDPLCLAVNEDIRRRAGFSAEDLEHERERRRRLLAGDSTAEGART